MQDGYVWGPSSRGCITPRCAVCIELSFHFRGVAVASAALSSSSALFKVLCGIAISGAASCMAKVWTELVEEMQCFGEECSADFVQVERHTSGVLPPVACACDSRPTHESRSM